MNKTGIIIQARTGSTRLPNKMLLSFFDEKTILDIIISRINKQQFNIPIIIATSKNSKDKEIVKIAERNNASYYCGDENDVLNRFICAANFFSLDSVIRICADNPFLSMNYLKKLIDYKNINSSDYISFITKDGTPSIKTHFGFWAEYITLDAMKRIQSLTNNTLYHEHVTNFAYTNPEIFSLYFLEIDDFVENSGIRLTVDTIDDFNNAKNIYKLLSENKKEMEPQNIIPLISEAMKINMKNQILSNSK
ncbi:glycosyl transferase family 2 [Treponema parvum]|uniref:Glycosyl transferase family 2 n=1 Tax=Treponema parvum TaxID=138851 RepID=A0A975EYI5_9SPIR|nr:hypothetical protein [Treponema parvum]QTQ11285.1 glycosyl transferase family 2 [Treponema parvum]QTQ16775.1 glycosyl transferase family 2 [Treponema parvum]